MADNVAITAGSGTPIATDDVSGAHYQRVKISDGTADSANHAVVDSTGALKVNPAGNVISTLNSTTTPLAGDFAEWFGSYEDVSQFNAIIVQWVCSPAASGSLDILWSTDGVSDITSDSFSDNGDGSHTVPVRSKFFRIGFQNAGAAHSTFQLQSILAKYGVSERVAGRDGTCALVLESSPSAADAGLVTRNIPSGTQTVSGPLTDTELRATAVPVSAASLPLPAGAATSAKQDAEISSLASIDGKITAVNTGAVVVSSSALPTGAATAAKQPAIGTAGTASADVLTVQGRAAMTPLLVDGSAVTQPVSVAGSVAVTGPLTDAQIRATALPVSGTVTVQDGGGSVTVDGTFWQATQPVSGPLTDAQLRAVAVPVSGTVTASGPLTDAELRAAAVPVSAASLPLPTGAATAAKQDTIIGHVDGIEALLTGIDADTASLALVTDTVNSTILGTHACLDTRAVIFGEKPNGDYINITATASGNLKVAVEEFDSALPTGANTIGAVNLAQYTPATGRLPVDGSGVTQPVSGTFFQATQPVSAASLPLPAGASTAAKQPAIGTAGTASADVITVQGIASMTALKVDGSAVTQPVSGTFWQATQPVSGPLTDTQLRATAVPVSGTVTVQDGGGSITVDGTFFQATQPVSGTVTANAGTGNFGVNLAQYLGATIGAANAQHVQFVDTQKATYMATTVAAGLAPGATPQDIFTITGSASKTVRITRIIIDGTATAATACPIYIAKRSTANSGGTSSARTAVPTDSASGAATATCLSYTANPTAGTLIANMASFRTLLPTPVGLMAHPLLDIDCTQGPTQAIVLRGTSEVLAVNLAGITAIGGWLFHITITWTEE